MCMLSVSDDQATDSYIIKPAGIILGIPMVGRSYIQELFCGIIQDDVRILYTLICDWI